MNSMEERKIDRVKFESDDLIYNRFDLIYKEDVESYSYKSQNGEYVIDAHYENLKAVLDVWGKKFPQNFFDDTIESIFERHSEIYYIEINRAGNDYKNLLTRYNDIRLSIPKTKEELMQKVTAKHRQTIRRKKRLLEDEYGRLTVALYKKDIPDKIVDQYFIWKRITHGTDYHMLPKEYLKKYYVTDGILLKAGDKNVGILFFCQINNTVYLENLSYNAEMEKYSPGYLVYEMFLEELINRKCLYLYLGGGEYEYKRKFGAEESLTYSGTIYRNEFYDNLNRYFEKNAIKRIAIYGLGNIGHAFLKIIDRLNIELVYGIDREEKQIEYFPVFPPTDDLKEVDAIIITLKYRNAEVEKLLNLKFEKVYYWHDIITENLGKEEM